MKKILTILVASLILTACNSGEFNQVNNKNITENEIYLQNIYMQIESNINKGDKLTVKHVCGINAIYNFLELNKNGLYTNNTKTLNTAKWLASLDNDNLSEIEDFTKTFAGYTNFSIKDIVYSQKNNNLSAVFAMNPQNMVNYLNTQENIKGVNLEQINESFNETNLKKHKGEIIGLSDNNSTNPYNALRHWIYIDSAEKIHSDEPDIKRSININQYVASESYRYTKITYSIK